MLEELPDAAGEDGVHDARLADTQASIAVSSPAFADGAALPVRFKTAWLSCDPPPGHGDHRYVFQVHALEVDPDLGAHPGRGTVIEALAKYAVARGVLVGPYGRAG